jgi:flagellar biosynthesis/type III secretory pathway protein FliH
MPHPAAASIRFRGCVVTEHREQAPTIPEKDRVEQQAKALAAEMVRQEVQKLKAAEQERWKAVELKWGKTILALQADIQKQLIDMSIRIAEIILQHQLPDRRMLRDMIEETLAPVSDLQGMRIRLSADDIAFAQEDHLSGSRKGPIEWVCDGTLKPGDVVIESRNGIFDGRLRERLDVLREALSSPEKYGTRHHPATEATA